MNTINNPLLLINSKKFPGYYILGAGDNDIDKAGSYVDLALAEEMLEALNWMMSRVSLEGSPYVIEEESYDIVQSINKLILKAKGE